tara:strand:+ start:197 stop:613 length:417 start_codon:yes stop_codon:yes gene_type:complete
MIKIQKENFQVDYEIEKIKSLSNEIGAVTNFIGYVRNINNSKKVKSIYVEVYEEMAIKSLKKICENAKNKWNLIDYLVIHRFGNLSINDKIVLVSTFSKHRKESFESCNFIMDYLKKEAPFWKKENYENESKWLKNFN